MRTVDGVAIEREYIVDAIGKWGSPVSVALLDPTCSLFKVPECEGLIGYRKIGSCIVVFGQPVCPQESLRDLMRAFTEYCASRCKNVIYIAVSESFSTLALQENYVRAAFNLLYEIVLNPMENPIERRGRKASVLRNKYSQSVRNGVTVNEYVGNDPELQKKIASVVAAWQQARKGPQIYLYSGQLFDDAANKRWFYAEHHGKVVGVVILNKIGGPAGWLLSLVALEPGTLLCVSEFMSLRIMEILRLEGCTYFSIGPSVAEQLLQVIGFNKFMRLLARGIFHVIVNRIFRMHKRHRYWDKFNPEKRAFYLLFDKPRIGASEIMGIMKALNAHR
jgi:lysylphosphatidylglycerol synthetase-like protein (DUF2156 family)